MAPGNGDFRGLCFVAEDGVWNGQGWGNVVEWRM